MKRTKVWINGKMVDGTGAKISVFDRGFLYGDGLFETMRSYAGIVFGLDEHMERLTRSLRVLKIKSPYKKTDLKDAIRRCIRTNSLDSAYVRLAVTRGEGRFGISHKDSFTPNVVISAKEFEPYPAWMYRRGLKVGTVAIGSAGSYLLSGLKTINFLPYIMARMRAKEDGFDDAVLLDSRGFIQEAATSNIFTVKGSVIMTPSLDCGVLPGITRAVIIKIARRLGLKMREGKIPRLGLLNSDEVFLTNSLAEVLPVTKVDSKKIGDGLPGKVTKLLHISYQKEVIRTILRQHLL